MADLLANLGSHLLLSSRELTKLVRSAPRRYKVFEIPKRVPGQFRTIAQPAKEVKALQYWVMEHVLQNFRVHPSATAYRDGVSIADNARPHAQGRFLLKLDFTDFFPSIKARDFQLFLAKNSVGLEAEEVEALSRILFWKPRGTQNMCLSIGAPSSPLLSNILMIDFDERVASVCAQYGVTYTRYADDLSFSADESSKLELVEHFVAVLCRRSRSPKLTLNAKKTVRVSRANSRRITGLILTNEEKVSLGRDAKRKIRAAVHHFVSGRLEKEQILSLKGMLAYVKSVEPEFLSKLRRVYGSEAITRIQKTL
jgi:retron-type reverse transcriptase